MPMTATRYPTECPSCKSPTTSYEVSRPGLVYVSGLAGDGIYVEGVMRKLITFWKI